MNKRFLILFFVIIKLVVFSQKSEIGISLLDYNTIRSYSGLTDTSSYSSTHGNVSIQPVLTFNHINSKDIDLFVQAGFFYLPGHANSKGTTSYDKSISYSSSMGLKKSSYLKIGIAKRHYIGKLTLITGVNIPFEYLFYQYSETKTVIMDSTKAITSIAQTFDKKAPYYITGLNLQFSVYYEVIKNISVGIDLNLGLQTSIINGHRKYRSTNTDYKYPQFDQDNTLDIVDKHSTYNTLNFQPTVSIRYRFSKAAKSN